MRLNLLWIFLLTGADPWMPALVDAAAEEAAGVLRPSREPWEDMERVVGRYAMLPKGVVVEGAAQGIEEINSLGYDKKKEAFIINGTLNYKNPISRKEWIQIFKSLRKTDNLGVTLLEGEAKAYGHLDKDSKYIKAMAETDRLEETDKQNIEHIRSNQQEYFKMPYFAKTVNAGEAAAFARLVRDSKKVPAEAILKAMD